MSLPDESKLKSIYEAGKKEPSLGLPTSGFFWSSSAKDLQFIYSVDFGNGDMYGGFKGYDMAKALCVGD